MIMSPKRFLPVAFFLAATAMGWAWQFWEYRSFERSEREAERRQGDLILAAAEGVLAGVPSRRWGGAWPDGLLVAATELNGAADIDALVEALGRIGR